MDKQIYEAVIERDIDLLLVEEFNVNDDFFKVIFNNKIPNTNIENIESIYAAHSIMSNNGETDIRIEFSIGKSQYILLIENKVDAPFQPAQSLRYVERKEKLLKENNQLIVRTVLIAPEDYLKGHQETSDFDIQIKYEEIKDYFDKNISKRNEFKSEMFRYAIEKLRRGPIGDPIVTDFWGTYRAYVSNHYSFIEIVSQRTSIPSGSDWPRFRLEWLPKNWMIIHKLDMGVIDLQTTLNEEQIKSIKLNTDKIKIKPTGISWSLSIPVPHIDRLKDFSEQIDDIKTALEQVKLFDENKEEILKSCK